MNKIRVLLFLGLLLYTTRCFVFADTVILKSGKRVEGQLIKTTEQYIEIDIFGTPVKYWKDEIEKIERDSVAEAPKPESVPKENTPEEYWKKALISLRDKNYGEAIADGESAIAEDNTYLRAYIVLEGAYFQLNKFDKTIDTSMKALSLDPDDLASNIYISLAYKNTGKKEQARAYFSKVVSLLDRQRKPLATLVEELLKDLNYL